MHYFRGGDKEKERTISDIDCSATRNKLQVLPRFGPSPSTVECRPDVRAWGHSAYAGDDATARWGDPYIGQIDRNYLVCSSIRVSAVQRLLGRWLGPEGGHYGRRRAVRRRLGGSEPTRRVVGTDDVRRRHDTGGRRFRNHHARCRRCRSAPPSAVGVTGVREMSIVELDAALIDLSHRRRQALRAGRPTGDTAAIEARRIAIWNELRRRGL